MRIKEPLISVIIAAYNAERYIGRCLRSLLHQTIPHEDYEIIVVNDGSNDKTSYALGLFNDAITVIDNGQNKGLPASINAGIKLSRAPYVVRVDSDDYVNSNFLNLLYLFIDQNPHIDAVACDYWLVDDNENWLERVNCMQHQIACGILFRKHQLLDIGMYDEEFRCYEDKDLRIRFEKKYKIKRVELPLYRYRRHDKNLTNDIESMEHHQIALIRKHGTDFTK